MMRGITGMPKPAASDMPKLQYIVCCRILDAESLRLQMLVLLAFWLPQ